jgi:hypothetical protein
MVRIVIDLHVHSTFSDGSLDPEHLAGTARKIQLTAMALTDHDTVGGVARFLKACEAGDGETRVVGIAGVEISADMNRGALHMLGYFIDPASESLAEVLHRIRDGRDGRNQQILANLRDLKVDVSMEEVREFVGQDVVGRPHIAQALVAKGHVATVREAFDKYLAKGKPGYADRFRLSPEDSILAIRNAAGVAVLAHPFTLGLDREPLRVFVGKLADMGLQGIEVFYPEHSPTQTDVYRTLAAEFGMVATGGSDFHGDMNPDIRLGRGFGNLHVPNEAVEALRAKRQQNRARPAP